MYFLFGLGENISIINDLAYYFVIKWKTLFLHF